MEELKSMRLDEASGSLEEERNQHYPVPEGYLPAGVMVFADVEQGHVVVSVNNMTSVRLSLQGARDLALLLRQKANLVEKRGRHGG